MSVSREATLVMDRVRQRLVAANRKGTESWRSLETLPVFDRMIEEIDLLLANGVDRMAATAWAGIGSRFGDMDDSIAVGKISDQDLMLMIRQPHIIGLVAGDSDAPVSGSQSAFMPTTALRRAINKAERVESSLADLSADFLDMIRRSRSPVDKELYISATANILLTTNILARNLTSAEKLSKQSNDVLGGMFAMMRRNGTLSV